MTNTCAKFQPSSLSGSCFMAGWWKTPPPGLAQELKARVNRVNLRKYHNLPWDPSGVPGPADPLSLPIGKINNYNLSGNQKDFCKTRIFFMLYKMYVTLKLDDIWWGRVATPISQGPCRIHVISDGDKEIVTNERYVVMPWKMVTRHGTNTTLKEAVDRTLNQSESEAKELEIRNRKREETENKRKESYEAHMKEETERLNELVGWYKYKLNEIRESPEDSRPRKLEKLYQYSEKN